MRNKSLIDHHAMNLGHLSEIHSNEMKGCVYWCNNNKQFVVTDPYNPDSHFNLISGDQYQCEVTKELFDRLKRFRLQNHLQATLEQGFDKPKRARL